MDSGLLASLLVSSKTSKNLFGMAQNRPHFRGFASFKVDAYWTVAVILHPASEDVRALERHLQT